MSEGRSGWSGHPRLMGAPDYKSAENNDPDGGSLDGSIVTANK